MGRNLILAGSILIVLGAILHFAPWLVNWFGRLPGDIRFEFGRSKIFIPITSMIVVSIVLTLLLNLFKR
jgi:uncharacterized membrane protein